MALSDMVVRQARITGHDYSLGDTDGLALNITARGSKIWHFRYYWAGKQKRMSLGGYPQISLKEACVQRDEARALVVHDVHLRAVSSDDVLCSVRKNIPLRQCLNSGLGSAG